MMILTPSQLEYGVRCGGVYFICVEVQKQKRSRAREARAHCWKTPIICNSPLHRCVSPCLSSHTAMTSTLPYYLHRASALIQEAAEMKTASVATKPSLTQCNHCKRISSPNIKIKACTRCYHVGYC